MSANIERTLYTGTLPSMNTDRPLTSSYDERTGESVDGWADIAHEAVRAMNHITSSGGGGEGIPAPVAYTVLGNLSGMAEMLPQLFRQLANGLQTSLDNFDVYDHKQDPQVSAIEAGTHLENAVAHAQRLADELSAAQVAINSQGYNTPDDDQEA